MKKMLLCLTALFLILACVSAQASGGWYCPSCGQYNESNYCPVDGTAKPSSISAPTATPRSSYYRNVHITFGSYRGESIIWRMLDIDGDVALLMSEYAVLCRPMDSSNYVSWRDSDLRNWLNSSFYRNAFSGLTQYMYQFETGEYVNIPSYDDMTNTRYGFSSNPNERTTRKCFPIEAVLREGNIYLSDSGSGVCGYFTRTVKKVKDDGKLIFWYVKANNTMNESTAARTDRGVRLMIRVDSSILY